MFFRIAYSPRYNAPRDIAVIYNEIRGFVPVSHIRRLVSSCWVDDHQRIFKKEYLPALIVLTANFSDLL